LIAVSFFFSFRCRPHPAVSSPKMGEVVGYVDHLFFSPLSPPCYPPTPKTASPDFGDKGGVSFDLESSIEDAVAVVPMSNGDDHFPLPITEREATEEVRMGEERRLERSNS